MNDSIKLKKETIQIEGGRNLYNYTFEIEEEQPMGAKTDQPPAVEGNLKPEKEEATE